MHPGQLRCCKLCCRPLIVIGKGAAYSQADSALRQLVDQAGLPFLATAMGRGVVPDTHAASANAARSMALAKADVAIVFGARCPVWLLQPVLHLESLLVNSGSKKHQLTEYVLRVGQEHCFTPVGSS